MLRLLPITLILLATVHIAKAGPETGSYDDFMQGAMIVYANEIEPSVKTSIAFLEHLNGKWDTIACTDACFQTGYQEAKAFVYNREVQNGFEIH